MKIPKLEKKIEEILPERKTKSRRDELERKTGGSIEISISQHDLGAYSY